MILPKLGHGLHQGVDHTNPFSNENGAVLLLIQLLSTLQCRKRSPKMEQFENALQSGAIWKRCFLKTLFSSVDRENDVIWKRWRNQNRQPRTRPLDCEYPKWRTDATMWLQFSCQFHELIYWNVHALSSFEHAHWGYKSVFKTDMALWCGWAKHYENDKCGCKSFWKRSKTTPFSFENGLVWMGPKSKQADTRNWAKVCHQVFYWLLCGPKNIFLSKWNWVAWLS